jgi:hypothetical protein
MHVKHPIFLQAYTLATDCRWKHILFQMSLGQCPPGVSIRDESIFFSRTGRTAKQNESSSTAGGITTTTTNDTVDVECSNMTGNRVVSSGRYAATFQKYQHHSSVNKSPINGPIIPNGIEYRKTVPVYIVCEFDAFRCEHPEIEITLEELAGGQMWSYRNRTAAELVFLLPLVLNTRVTVSLTKMASFDFLRRLDATRATNLSRISQAHRWSPHLHQVLAMRYPDTTTGKPIIDKSIILNKILTHGNTQGVTVSDGKPLRAVMPARMTKSVQNQKQQRTKAKISGNKKCVDKKITRCV